jgi:hypothetical protein
MAQTMAMGQAAGTAAALSLQHQCGAREVPVPALQAQLRASGAVLKTPSRIAAIRRGDWLKNRTA